MSSDYFSPVRTLLALALVLTACSGGDRSKPSTSQPATPTRPARGPQALMLRVPRGGGVARVTSYPNIDSVVWTGSDAVPALDRVLAFDAEAGAIAAATARNAPVWIDLRVGRVTIPVVKSALRNVVSVDGEAVFAIGADGAVVRFTPTGNLPFKTPLPPRAIFPQINGSLLILAGRGSNARIWRMHPPDNRLTDSVMLADATAGASAPLGDRVYFLTGPKTLVGVHARTLQRGTAIEFDRPIENLAATPSGDRFYVTSDSGTELGIVARFQDRIAGRVTLPGRARELRVDPFGRYLLARAATGDSVWIVSVGADKVIGTVHTAWRGDLPFVAPDGAVALQSGNDVAFIDPQAMREVRRAADGASDFWYPFVWTGFRPRSASLDTPATFSSDSDTVSIAPPVRVDSVAPATIAPVDSIKNGFTVSFAALLDETRAREQAGQITVEGQTARVVTTVTDGTAVYRVVLGPYPTREEAERVGRASAKSYVVYAGSP
jgi:hypothetical protein